MIPLEQKALRQSFLSVMVSIRRTANRKTDPMKYRTLITLSLLPTLLVSCANQGGEDYDVSNPFAAPDYADETGTPYLPSDVNPAYDSPAVYEDTTPAPTRPAARPAAPRATVHTIVRGDTLWGLSKKYGVSVDAIKQANGMTRDTVVLGSKIRIPAR
jgi:LysM repeat protein